MHRPLTRRAGDWGIAAFTGHNKELPKLLGAQECLYTLMTRGPAGDDFRVVASLSAAHPGSDQDSLLSYLSAPDVRVVTLTITEAGYCRDSSGRLDRDNPRPADIETLRRDASAPIRTVPGRLGAGLGARLRAEAGPIAIVSCDNLAGMRPWRALYCATWPLRSIRRFFPGWTRR